ncbi:MAG: glycosyltransferase family 2 protein [Brachymonas sp.]|nr:glycosyltransferase family 2 protein [Brachymonas sp.]
MLLSAYLITLNESEHLAEVLARLQGVDEIVVVDSGSTDGTQDIARRFGARVVHNDWPGFAKQKAYAMSLCQGTWVLSMDGDEVLQEGAIAHIRQLIANTPYNGFTIPRHEVFMGRPMTHSRPDQMMRLYRKDKAEWDLIRLVHEHVEVEKPTSRITPYMIHYGNDTITKALHKINNYSSLKAEQKFQTGSQGSITKMLLSPVAYFVRYMLLRSYWKEALPGLVFSTLWSFYSFLSEAKLLQRQRISRS